MNITEQETLISALDKFTQITGITSRVLSSDIQGHRYADAIIQIEREGDSYILEAEVKSELRTAALNAILDKNILANGRLLLVSRYIPAPLKDELRAKKLGYIETSGNCFVETRGLYIYVNDRKTAPAKSNPDTKMWAPSGMKFIFAVLMDPSILNSSYRNMANIAKIALGNVGNFISELKKENFIVMGTENKRPVLLLENRLMLIDKWADMYRTILRPRQLIGRFRFLKKEDRENWHSLSTIELKICWGAETAGAILTGYLSPQVYTIYSNENRIELMRKLRIVPDPNGEVELLRPFWNDEESQSNQNIVPPLLAYAELISSFDSRNRETAERIKIKYVK